MNQSRVFRIESKSFSVRTDNLSRGGAILITEKSRGKSFLISLEVDCVVWLRNQLGDALKGSEAQFFRQFKGDSFLFWVERHCNSKGWFLRLSKCTRGVVRSLVIPQGKNAIGWRTMEESLGSLLNFNGKKSLSDDGSRSSSFSYRDAVKGSNEVQKGGSRSMGGANRNWDLTLVIERKQVHNSWKEISGALSVSLGRAVHIFPFQPSKAFMDCESGEELQRLLWGSTSLNGGLFEVAFSSWEESWGLNDAKVVSYGGWVAVSGLPLNWWNPKILSQVGEACGGILQIDRVTDRFLYLHEAKIKVKENNSGFLPQFVKVSEGDDAVFVTISPISPAIKPPSNGKAMVTFTDGRQLKSTAIDGVSAFQQDEGQSRSFPVGRADKDGTWRRKDVCTKLGTAQKGGFSALDGVQREKEGKVMENSTRATHFGNRFSPSINCCLGEDVFLKGSAAPEEFSSLYRVEDFLDDLGVEKVVPITAVFSDSELDFISTGPKLEKTVPNKHGGSILGAGPVPSLFLPSSKPSRHSDFGPGLFRPSAPSKNPPSASSFFSKYGNGAHTLRRNDPKYFGSFKAKEAAASTDFSDGEEDSCDTDEIDSELELLSDFGDGLDSCRDSVREDLLRGDGSVLDFDDADSSQQDAGEGLDITLCEDGMLEKLFGDLTPTPELEVIPDFTGKEEGELKIQVDDPGLSNSSSSVSLVGKKDKTGNNSVKIQTYCRRKELPPVPIKKTLRLSTVGYLLNWAFQWFRSRKPLFLGKMVA